MTDKACDGSIPNLHVAIIAASIAIYLVLSLAFGLEPLKYSSIYGLHELRVFLAFFVFPLTALAAKRRLDGIYGGGRGVLVNLGIYTLLMPTMVYLLGPLGTLRNGLAAYIVALVPVIIQVISVDFFIRRIIQYPVSIKYGANSGVCVAFVIWCLAHIIEITALGTIYGLVNITIFVAVSGLFLAVAYEATGDIVGQMLGHVMINAVFMAMY